VFPKAGHASAAQRAIGRAARARTNHHGASLFNGFVGLAWVVEFLVGNPDTPADADPNAWVDETIEPYLSAAKGPYDLVSGLVGIGVYALERMPRPSGQRLVALVVKNLAETARRKSPGVAWWSDPKWGTSGAGWNLGLAHGVPGVISFLGRVVGSKVDSLTTEKARRLLDSAVEWVLAQELSDEFEGSFAYRASPRKAPAFLAWCYGDPGVAAALLVAAKGTASVSLEKAAMRVALRAAGRTFESSKISDPGLCHGAAGVAHIFHRMYMTTGEMFLADAARRWFDRALAMRGSRGFAGFSLQGKDKTGRKLWRVDPSFLTGGAGIALALASATGSEPLLWDRALLLS